MKQNVCVSQDFVSQENSDTHRFPKLDDLLVLAGSNRQYNKSWLTREFSTSTIQCARVYTDDDERCQEPSTGVDA